MPPAQVVEDDAPGEEGNEADVTAPPPKAEEEGADYGEPSSNVQSPKPQLTRAMPDYADLIVDDGVKPVVKDSDAGSEMGRESAAAAPKRPDAILISGVERLNRGHIAEVFEAKDLPEFVRLDWIADSDVIAVFADDDDARKALTSALEGFRDVPDDGAPGPGLWRARRAMLDFRQATIADQPELGYRRQHRAGRQVKDYRLWTALTDMDKQILEKEENSSAFRKRSAPGTAKEEEQEGAPKKKARKSDDTIDMLERMANQDRKILVKQEEAGILEPLPEAPPPEPEPEIPDLIAKFREEQEYEAKRWKEDKEWWGSGGWEHDDRDGGGGRWRSEFRERWSGKGGKRSKGKGKGKDNGKGKRTKEDNRSRAAAADVLGSGVELSEEEKQRRARRSERFGAETKKES